MTDKEETMHTAEAARKPEAHWFFGVVSNAKEFMEYFESTYTYEKLVCIHPVELRDICKEALEFAKYFKQELPDHVKGMVDDPIAFSQEAIDQGIIPGYSEITLINEEQGTNYHNMVEYLNAIREHTGQVQASMEATANTEEECIDDIESYVSGLGSKP
jgi:hypothetical protein